MIWIEIPTSYLVKDGIQLVRLPEKTFCLAYHTDRFIAFSQKCPHARAPLHQGWIEGEELVCPYHRQRFDLHTGRGAVGQGNFITIYPTKQIDGKWHIGLKRSFWQKLF